MSDGRRVPVEGASPPRRPERLMSCAKPRANPRPLLRQVMNAERNHRTSLHVATPRPPRQGLTRSHAARRRNRTSPKARRTEVRFLTRPVDPLDEADPKARTVRVEARAAYSRSAAGDVSGRHLQSTCQRRAPRLSLDGGDHSPRTARFTPARPASPRPNSREARLFGVTTRQPIRTLTPLSPAGE